MYYFHMWTYVFFSLKDDDDEVGDDEDEDDGFFVPHGYLSEDEGVTEVSGCMVRRLVKEELSLGPELDGC